MYQQDGFSATLDRKLGLQYSDKVSIRHLREEVFSAMRQINKQGHYSQHLAAKKLPSTRQEQRASKGEFLLLGVDNAEILASNQPPMLNIPSSKLADRGGYKLDIVKPEVSGRSMYSSFHGRMVAGGRDDKMFDSSPRLTAFEGGPSHRMHTYNTRKSVIQSQDNLADSLRRLSDFRLMIDQTHCPRYKKMKEQRLSTRQQQICEREQRNLSALKRRSLTINLVRICRIVIGAKQRRRVYRH